MPVFLYNDFCLRIFNNIFMALIDYKNITFSFIIKVKK